jgi:hypothetical protein
MGLDISVLANPVFVRDLDRDYDISEGEMYVSVSQSNFFERADGVKAGIYKGERTNRFRAGSYSGYNDYRNMLAEAGMGAEDRVIWKQEDKFRGQPFWEQVNFSDCEGTIGPKTSAKLAKDYAENRQKFSDFVLKTVGGDKENHEYYMYLYDEWAAAFKTAAETGGLVIFH